jgi:hypothetical protein
MARDNFELCTRILSAITYSMKRVPVPTKNSEGIEKSGVERVRQPPLFPDESK